MQEKHLFEYAVVRVVPRVEREEFVNIGIILYCPSERFLQTSFHVNKDRILSLTNGIDLEDLEKHLDAFKRICKGGQEGGTIGSMSLASRFRWLTATRSTILQTSPVHLGLCSDPKDKIDRLLNQLVC